MFVGLDRISEHRVTVIPKHAGSSGTKTAKNLQKRKSEQQLHQEKSLFEPGDRVMVFDDSGGTILGTVRWTGGGSSRIGKIAGIETVSEFISIKMLH